MIFFVPTPIGNRDDITLRALSALKEADFICCEDTRHSAPLLQHLGISKPLVSLHDHNERQKSPEIVRRAAAGETVAVISDAGMPGVSDPGYRLLQEIRAAGVAYTVLPGPSAVLTALVGSGMPSDAFFFGGFLPPKSGRRMMLLDEARQKSYTTIFFESPHRILKTLGAAVELDPELPVCVARELTKTFETYHRGSAAELLAHFTKHPPKGEIVFLVGGVNCPRGSGQREDEE